MPQVGEPTILQYAPGEKETWLELESAIVEWLVQTFKSKQDLLVTVKALEPELREIKRGMRDYHWKKFDYHAERAGQRFFDTYKLVLANGSTNLANGNVVKAYAKMLASIDPQKGIRR